VNRALSVRHGVSLLTADDIHLFGQGNHFKLYDKLGAHVMQHEGSRGTLFGLWAPNAERVSVVGDFNDWNADSHDLLVREDGSGIWEGFVPEVTEGAHYKYHVRSRYNGYRVDKGDPFAKRWEPAPGNASIVWNLDYEWSDSQWRSARHEHNALSAPWAVYELHLGSWRRVVEDGQRYLSYREMAADLADYVAEMGYTHVELMPVMEHPFYGSWGYQVTGFFAPTSRYGDPQDFMYLIDALHQRGIGVVLDWVPSHFPSDEHGLSYFDGTYLYEHADPKRGFHPEWNSYIFNYGRHEVRSFLISSACIWLDRYHADGLRVDAVASMLYLDYARKAGEWLPNEHGGKEDLAAIHLLRRLNEAVYEHYPGTQVIAEESTAWPMVSRPTYLGGLGFGMKWNMGWMHDTLSYMSKEPIHRKYHHDQLTFGIWYAFNENFMLPLSHDEVVYGKGSLIGRMPGDDWQRFANLRLLYGFMYAHPGKKLMFMGGELGQWSEWNHERSLDWHLLEHGAHSGLNRWVRDLNTFYRGCPAMHGLDFEDAGFEWIDCRDWEESVVSFIRRGSRDPDDEIVIAVFNFTPVPRHNYVVGAPRVGLWHEALNSDAELYGGSGQGNQGAVEASPVGAQGRFHSLSITLPPLAAVYFRSERLC
jgi:1,4-alpha-glucan branching enzyme